MRFLFIKKKWLVVAALCLAIGVGWYIAGPQQVVETWGPKQQEKKEEFTIKMVTGEFKTKTEDGKEIEAYRWDPGTIFVPQGEEVKISIYGVNGDEHPFKIEGTDIKGTVKKGEETVINVRFDEEGVYKLICLTHPDIEHNGPMIGYIVVD